MEFNIFRLAYFKKKTKKTRSLMKRYLEKKIRAIYATIPINPSED